MQLLVMGAGYVGMELLSYLKKEPHDVFITTTHKERVSQLKPYGKDVLVLDPANKQALRDLINACDLLFVLIAPTSPQPYEEVYLNTAKEISHALEHRQKPFRIIYTSSTSVCEGAQGEWITEKTPLFPPSENSKILLETEKIYLNSNASTCILRLGGIYGPGRELTKRARYFSEKKMPTSGDEPTNHIHLDDIVKGLLFCLDRSLTGIYHLVNDDHPSKKDLYDSLCKSMNIPPPLWSEESHKSGYKISNEKIKQAGFVFKHPIIKYDSK